MEAIQVFCDEEALGSTYNAGGFSRWDLLNSLAVGTRETSGRETNMDSAHFRSKTEIWNQGLTEFYQGCPVYDTKNRQIHSKPHARQ